jgi:hypothetical protein
MRLLNLDREVIGVVVGGCPTGLCRCHGHCPRIVGVVRGERTTSRDSGEEGWRLRGCGVELLRGVCEEISRGSAIVVSV